MKPFNVQLKAITPAARYGNKTSSRSPHSRPPTHTNSGNPLIAALTEICKKREFACAPDFIIYMKDTKESAAAKRVLQVKPLSMTALAQSAGCQSALDYLRGMNGVHDTETAQKHVRKFLQVMGIKEDSDEWKTVMDPKLFEDWETHILQKKNTPARGE